MALVGLKREAHDLDLSREAQTRGRERAVHLRGHVSFSASTPGSPPAGDCNRPGTRKSAARRARFPRDPPSPLRSPRCPFQEGSSALASREALGSCPVSHGEPRRTVRAVLGRRHSDEVVTEASPFTAHH